MAEINSALPGLYSALHAYQDTTDKPNNVVVGALDTRLSQIYLMASAEVDKLLRDTVATTIEMYSKQVNEQLDAAIKKVYSGHLGSKKWNSINQ